jgi:hypothetical protein
VVVAIRLHNQQSNNFREEQRQNAKWLLTCHITNIILIFRAAGGKIWAWRL